jgi:hypothetical protein
MVLALSGVVYAILDLIPIDPVRAFTDKCVVDTFGV